MSLWDATGSTTSISSKLWAPEKIDNISINSICLWCYWFH
jgi:hypothetical protein